MNNAPLISLLTLPRTDERIQRSALLAAEGGGGVVIRLWSRSPPQRAVVKLGTDMELLVQPLVLKLKESIGDVPRCGLGMSLKRDEGKNLTRVCGRPGNIATQLWSRTSECDIIDIIPRNGMHFTSRTATTIPRRPVVSKRYHAAANPDPLKWGDSLAELICLTLA